MIQLGRYKEALELKNKAYGIDTTLYWIPDEIPRLNAIVDSLENE